MLAEEIERAREKIAEEKAARTGFLTLWKLYLSYLPDELAELSHLKSLDISDPLHSHFGSKRTDLSPLKDLENLERLDCSSTQISDLSPEEPKEPEKSELQSDKGKRSLSVEGSQEPRESGLLCDPG